MGRIILKTDDLLLIFLRKYDKIIGELHGGEILTNIYIIRHGETDSNIRQSCIGHKDVPLNEAGHEQAKQLAERLKGIKLDAVYSSPLNRAVDTVNPAIMALGVPVTMSFALIERDFGAWDDMTFGEIEEKYPEEFRQWNENWAGYRVPEGESGEDVQNRVNAFVGKMLQAHKDQTVALVTHLGTARHLISALLGLTVEQSWLFTLDNAKYALIGIDNDRSLLKGLNL